MREHSEFTRCRARGIMGRPRRVHPIEEIPLVGGELCLDFVNTTGDRAGDEPRERLHAYSDLLTWSFRVGILDDSQVAHLGRLADERPEEATDVLERALGLREDLYVVLRHAATESEPDPTALASLASWWRRYRSRSELVREGEAFRLVRMVDEGDLDRMLWPVIRSAADLLTSGRVRVVKRCGACDWLFLDETKNQTRVWCKRQCGNRVRARRHYARRREDAGVSSQP